MKVLVIVTARLPGSYRTKSPAQMVKPLALKGDPLATTHEMEGATVVINLLLRASHHGNADVV